MTDSRFWSDQSREDGECYRYHWSQYRECYRYHWRRSGSCKELEGADLGSCHRPLSDLRLLFFPPLEPSSHIVCSGREDEDVMDWPGLLLLPVICHQRYNLPSERLGSHFLLENGDWDYWGTDKEPSDLDQAQIVAIFPQHSGVEPEIW